MSNMSSARQLTGRIGSVIALVATLAACGGPKYSYKEETFDKKGPFERHFVANADIAFAAMKKVLLRQGYTMEKQESNERAFVASKQFQHDDVNTLLTISGIASSDGNLGSDTWMAAQEVQYKVNEQKHTSSVSFLLVSIPVPTGSTKSLSKDRGETIQDKEFYDKLFSAIEHELPAVKIELEAGRKEENLKMREEIERRLRTEMEVKQKLEQEARVAAAAQAKLDEEARVAAAAKLRQEEQARLTTEIRAQLESEAKPALPVPANADPAVSTTGATQSPQIQLPFESAPPTKPAN